MESATILTSANTSLSGILLSVRTLPEYEKFALHFVPMNYFIMFRVITLHYHFSNEPIVTTNFGYNVGVVRPPASGI